MAFKFITISEQDIRSSRGGEEMMDAITYAGPFDQFITGRPGSGKTTVTLMRARWLAAQGKVVLLLTKHNLLVYSLKNNDPASKANIYGVYDWFYERYKDGLDKYQDGESLRKKIESTPKFAEILIDEGQDLPEHFYEAIPAIAHKLLVGADTAQRVYANGASAQAIERALTAQGRNILPTELEYNYRNYVETYDFARQFVPEVSAAHTTLILKNTTKGNGGVDYLPVVIQCSNRITELLNVIRNNSLSNIAIVVRYISDVVFYHNELQKLGIACSMYHSKLTASEKWVVANEMESVLVTTYWSVKGLEFPVVIMPDMENALTIFDKHTPNHYYVSCTRATEHLYLLYQGPTLPSCLQNFSPNSFRHFPLGASSQQVRPPVPPVTPINNEDFF